MITEQLLVRAAAAAEGKDWATAAALLRDLPPTDDNLRTRGWYRSRAKQYDLAIADYTRLCRRRPRDYFPHYMLGFRGPAKSCVGRFDL